jgi:hypothetical protein
MTEEQSNLSRRKFVTGTAALGAASISGCLGVTEDDGGLPGNQPWTKFIHEGKDEYQGRFNGLKREQKRRSSQLDNLNNFLEEDSGEKLKFNFDENADPLEENEVTIDNSVLQKYSTDESVYEERGVEIAPGIVLSHADTQEVNRQSSVQDDGKGATNAEFASLEGEEVFGESLGDVEEFLNETGADLNERQRREVRSEVNDLSSVEVKYEKENNGENAEQPIFPEGSYEQLLEDVEELRELEAVFQYQAFKAGEREETASVMRRNLGEEEYESSLNPFGPNYDEERDLTDVEAHQMVEGLEGIEEEASEDRIEAVARAAEVGVLRRKVEYAANEFADMAEIYDERDLSKDPGSPVDTDTLEKPPEDCGVTDEEYAEIFDADPEDLQYREVGEDRYAVELKGERQETLLCEK